MSYGITSGGFVIPTLEQIITEREAKCKSRYGIDFQATDDNLIWQSELIDAEREFKAWQLMEAVYNSQTLEGSEGVYLDDVLGLRGLYRRGATASNGFAVIEADQTVDNTTTITNTTNFNSNTGVIYKVDVATDFTERVVGMLITKDDFIGVQTYTFSYTDPDTGSSYVVTGNSIDAANSSQVTNFLESIVTSITTNTSITSEEISVANPNTDDVVLRFGYSTDNTLEGVSVPSNYTMSPELGVKASSFFVRATKTGLNPLTANGIISVSPSNVGFLNVTNVEDFNAGSNIESDTVYRLRAGLQTSGTALGSEARIVEALNALDGVTDVKIFANPSVSPVGGVEAGSFETVISGGDTAEIAETIYKNKALTDGTSGEITYGVDTLNGGSEDISFSRATPTALSVRVSYTTTTGVVLSAAEQTAIKNALVSFSDTFIIGGVIFNANLQGVVFGSLAANRLSNLTVETKLKTDPDTSYTTNNLQAPNRVLYIINDEDIEFTRI